MLAGKKIATGQKLRPPQKTLGLFSQNARQNLRAQQMKFLSFRATAVHMRCKK